MANDDRNNIFKTAVIATPVAIGGLATYRRLEKNFNKFTQPVVPSYAVNKTVREFANQYNVQPSLQGVLKHYHAEQMRGLASSTSLTAKEIRESVLRAARQADPTGSLTKMLDERLAFAGTGQEALRDVAHILEENTSIYARRATEIFMEDIGVLEGQTIREITALQSEVMQRVANLAPRQLSAEMQAELSKIQQLTGAEVSIQRVGRADIPGSELHFTFSRGRLPRKFTLRVPEILKDRPGLIVRGTTQQSRYIAGTYGIIEEGILKESFNHEQWTLRRAAEDLIPQIMNEQKATQRAVNSMVHRFESKIMEAPEWVPSIEPGIHTGVDEYIRMRSQVMHLYRPGGAPISEFEYADLMKRGGAILPEGNTLPLFPGHSPSQIAKGIVSTIDVRSGIALVPEAVPYGRRPLQFLRKDFTPTQGALSAMAESKLNEDFKWASANFGVKTPMIRAGYVSGELGPTLAGTGVTAEGQLLVSDRLATQRAVRQWKQFDVASNQMTGLANLIDKETGSSWSINKLLPKGTFLGYGPEGRPVTLPEEMFVTQATAFAKDAAKGDFIRVMAMKDIENIRYSKVFGGAKGMAVSVSPEYLEKVLTQHAGVAQTRGDIYRGIDAIITMDELKKNRGLHYNQMFTSLWDFTKQNMKSGLTQGSTFAQDPAGMIADIRKAALNADKFDHETVLQRIVGLAREAKLTSEQMGHVFGAVPEVFGGIEAMGPLSAAEEAEIRKGFATGATQLFFEGLGGPGAGRTATIEPRMFELLAAPHFGTLGPQIQKEVAERMVTAYPHRLIEQKTITKALLSVMTPKAMKGAKSAADILENIGKSSLPLESTGLRIAGIGDIVVPSAATVSQLAGYKTAAGLTVEPPLALAYRKVLETAEKHEAREVTDQVMRKELANLQNELATARIASVTGTKGLLRHRLPGSAFLTAVQPTLGEQLSPNVVGVTAPYAEQMFKEMRRLDLYDVTELDAMQKRFMSGGRVAGIVGRHPYIGPFSTQAVEFQKVAGHEPIAMINERMQRAIAYGGKLEGEALESFEMGARNALKGNKYMLRRMNQIGAETLGSPIRLSPFVGMAGDVDGDVISAMFAGPQLEKSLSSHVADRSAMEAYEEYAIRSQVLKAKAAGDQITLRKAMAGDVIKLGITEGGRLGKLSVALQQQRAAVLSGMGGLSAQERMSALGLLEWMEQTPISGKHIKSGQEVEMINLLDDIQGALDKKDANGIADAARRVLADAKMSGQKALRDGFTIAMEDVGTGEVTTRYIQGIDINKTAENIMKASNAYDATIVGRQSAAKLRKMIMGRGGLSTGREAMQLMRPDVLEMSPFGAFFNEVSRAPLSELAMRASTAVNKLGAAGRSVLTHARPLALGGAAALGVAALLSEPPRILPPGANVPLGDIMKSGSGGEDLDTNLHPDTHIAGAPTAKSPIGNMGEARIAQEEGYRVNIKGNVPQSVDYKSLATQIRQSVGKNARINSTVRDQRSSLTAQKLSSILHDE